MINLIKNYWLIILLSLTATFLGLGKLYLSLRPPVVPQTYDNTWNGMTPGITSIDDLSRFGNPVKAEKTTDGTDVFNYNSEVGDLKNKIYLKEGKVGLIKEQIWNKESLQGLKTKYGNPQGEYFGEYSVANYKVYLYPTQGLAVIAHIDDGFILEKWYFQPMTMQEFLSSWGKELTTEPQKVF